MSTSEDAAVAAATGIVVGSVEAPEEIPASGSDEVEFPSFVTEVPPDILAELEEDDEDLTVDDNDLARLSNETGEDNPELLRRLAEAEKRAAHLEKLRVNEARKNWATEAEKFFPLAQPFLEEINATSRRGFLRTAKNLHDRMLPLVEEKVLKPARESIAKEKEAVVTEARTEAEAAWGTPVTEDKTTEVPASAQTARARQRRGELSDTVRLMLFPKKGD